MLQQHFHREIDRLKESIAQLGGLVESAVGKALTSLRENDQDLAGEVRQSERRIDEMEVEIEEHLLKLMALYQPVARDLRFLVTVLKVNNLLEYMGDLAESIARKTQTVPKGHLENSPMSLFTMGKKTQEMVMLSLDALLKQDTSLAREVIAMDDEIDHFHGENHRIVAKHIAEKRFHKSELDMLSVSRSLERIADLAATVAEDVIYSVDAVIVRHRKGGA
ncbi:MAG: phosphate signaling complex protein PhoU [Acidobacteriota bacterium]|nr:phosphate signaling complex protein PhoU [Acidobacteriota bacterium]